VRAREFFGEQIVTCHGVDEHGNKIVAVHSAQDICTMSHAVMVRSCQNSLAGVPQYEDAELLRNHGARLDNVGDWAVICDECAKTHRCQIVPIENTSPTGVEETP